MIQVAHDSFTLTFADDWRTVFMNSLVATCDCHIRPAMRAIESILVADDQPTKVSILTRTIDVSPVSQ